MNTTEKSKTTLVVGASGATGKELVNQLLNLDQNVKIIVRSKSRIPSTWKANSKISIIENSILNLSDLQMQDYVKDCDAIASCLGHNLTFKGIYGHPRRLVTDATKKLVNASIHHKNKKPIKFVLMNTSGNSNRDLNESVPFSQKCVIALLRLLLPPHVDNEKAADYLRTENRSKS
ncbi:NAD(P)H-binding protein [Psychroserpens ponticola]|uniref:NAD(P)H-binding protein n=1 Tax=Psychroserpens ponticola TaxID=2932268 RepID=A0ABY7RVE2_9FLAO|nr:NAD(P)H-binding protein [Psychroserpens ponticola]WCO01090.1 NAD(P)H-binding protein [Psychroserpens ponticola]